MPYHWPQVLDRLQSYKPTLHYQMVSWRKPSEGWVTCNTDGASKGNPGVSSYGYCIRDMNGDLIYAEAHNLGETTNMEAEATAVWKALQYCLDNGVRQVRLETDSLALKNMIYGSWSIPWEIVEKVEDIQEKMQQLNVQGSTAILYTRDKQKARVKEPYLKSKRASNGEIETKKQGSNLGYSYSASTGQHEGLEAQRGQEKMINLKYLLGFTELKCKAHTLYRAQHEPTPESTPKSKERSAQMRKCRQRKGRKAQTFDSCRQHTHHRLIMKNVDCPKKKNQELSVEELH
ncbi:hypothetical protein KY284_030499 [Solanum tuberosum]|nr:hypothetical protein KY284_030499 [Solanum tuberosum]